MNRGVDARADHADHPGPLLEFPGRLLGREMRGHRDGVREQFDLVGHINALAAAVPACGSK